MPAALLAKGAASMVKRSPLPADRQAELRQDFANNVPQHVRQALREYLSYLGRHEDPAERLCRQDVPLWVVHAEKGDGGLTDAERATLEAADNVTLVTIPGSVFLLPDEAPEQTAAVIAAALAKVSHGH